MIQTRRGLMNEQTTSSTSGSHSHFPLHTTLINKNDNSTNCENEIPSFSPFEISKFENSNSRCRRYRRYRHRFIVISNLSLVQVASSLFIVMLSVFHFHHANALAFHPPSTSSRSSINTLHNSIVSLSAKTNNALDLLNTARLIREQKLDKISSHPSSLRSSSSPAMKSTPNSTKSETKQINKKSRDKPLSSFNNRELQSLALQELLQRTAAASALAATKKKSTKQQSSSSSSSSLSSPSWTQTLFDDEYNDNNIAAVLLSKEEEFISNRVQKQLPSVKSLLQTSYGNDVPDMELHLQMEAARARGMKVVAEGNTSGNPSDSVAALAFMDLHHAVVDSTNESEKDTQDTTNEPNTLVAVKTMHMNQRKSSTVSTIEKVAMSSLPSQLPGLAAPVLNGNSGGRRTENGAKVSATTTQRKGRRKKKATTENIKIAKENAYYSKENTPKRIKVQHSSSRDDSIQRFSQDVEKINSKDISNIQFVRKTLDEMSSSTDRVSHDEEIELARIIQRGAEVHRIKFKFEQDNMRDISRTEWVQLAKLESPKELRRLVSDYRKSKNKLVMANMGLVHAVVRSRMRESGRASVSYEGVSYEEMVQEGSLGLLRAAELFDPSRGLRFSTYATIWIKGVLGNNSLSETITLPLREKNKWKKIQQSIEEITAEKGVDTNGGGYKPSEEEIASHCGIKANEIKAIMMKMKRTKNVLSLDYQYDSQSRSGVGNGQFEALSNDKNMMDDVDLVEKLQLRADVVAALTRNLDPREARLMRLRYGLNDGKTRSIRDCAEAMGISKARAQQLAVGCLKKLREADDAESLQEYLLSVA